MKLQQKTIQLLVELNNESEGSPLARIARIVSDFTAYSWEYRPDIGFKVIYWDFREGDTKTFYVQA